MSNRIGELEDAVAALWPSTASEGHPLLRRDLLSVKLPPDTQNFFPPVLEKGEVLAKDFDAPALRGREEKNVRSWSAGEKLGIPTIGVGDLSLLHLGS
jgi:hypothetical protein